MGASPYLQESLLDLAEAHEAEWEQIPSVKIQNPAESLERHERSFLYQRFMELVPPRDSSLPDTTRAAFRCLRCFSRSEQLPATSGQSDLEPTAAHWS